jgi:hypothetical protein
LKAARECIPKIVLRERKSTHPWVNDRVLELVKAKHKASGTVEAKAATVACSAGMKVEYAKHIQKQRVRLARERRASKGWWSKTRRLLKQKTKICNIPALKRKKGEWCTTAKSKADLLADTFKSKYTLGEQATNHYTEITASIARQQRGVLDVTEEQSEKVLHNLRNDSATGPDGLPTRILKECAKVLAKPFRIVAKLILAQSRWPEAWTMHWIVPLHKRKNVYDAVNYRGIHLTAQLSKAMERLLRCLFTPFLLKTCAYGPNQFAYTPERGARDVLALMTMVWISALSKKRKIAIYCSDVAGAFDRVSLKRLVAKLSAKQIHPDIVAVIASWLRTRKAKVVVGGEASEEFDLMNMVYQGTVLGPTLWNIFYEDARHALHEFFFTEVVFADDLNGYRVFPGTTSKDSIIKSLTACQKEVHSWGDANQVAFEPTKESFHIVADEESYGGQFKLLGICFDTNLTMGAAIDEVVNAAAWKLKMLVRTRRYYTDSDLIVLYKAHLLPYVEYRTSAIYHATRDLLGRLDRIQSKFLQDIGVSEEEALLNFSLAPLEARRDIAILGLIHRTALGKGPRHFKDHLVKESAGKFRDPRDTLPGALVRRSTLGLVAVYNMLPDSCKTLKTVRLFQQQLQAMLKERLADGCSDWMKLFSPRIALDKHPLKC